MLTFRCLALALLLMGPATLLSAKEKEERDEDDKPEARSESTEIPGAAISALTKLAGKSKLQRILVLGGEIKVFEGLWKHDDETQEATVSAKGDLLELEEELEEDDVPKAVKKAGKTLKSKGVIYVKKVMTFYEVEVGSGEDEKSILVDATGRKVTLKYSDEEDEDDEEDDDDEKVEVKKSSEKKGKAKEKDEDDEEDEKPKGKKPAKVEKDDDDR